MKKNKILTYVAAFVVTVSTFTLIQGYFPFFMKSWVFFSSLVILITLLYPMVYLEKSIICLMMYSIVILLNYLSRDEVFSLSFALNEITFYFIPTALFLIYLRNDDLKSLKIMSTATVLVIIITSVLTILQAYNNPSIALGIVRSIVAAQINENYTYIIDQYRKGVTSYAMPHAFPFIVPPLICALKDNKVPFKKRFFALAVIVIGTFMVFFSQSTGALVILCYSFIMSLIVTGKSSQRNTIRLIVLGCLAGSFLNSQILISILDSLGAKVETMTYYGKIEDVMTMLETGGSVGEIAYRQELHNMSLNAFLGNLLLGTNKGSDIGGHAYFMDRAGLLGLTGIIPLFLFFFFQVNITYKSMPNPTRIYYLIGVSAFIILGFQKNMAGFEYWLYLFFLLPSLCLSLYNKQNA